MDRNTYVAVADLEGREVALLPTPLPSDTADLALAVVGVLISGREELGGRPVLVIVPEIDPSGEALGGHAVEPEENTPSLKTYQLRSPHSNIMTHGDKICTWASGRV
jgi:hypothetical protein